MGADVLPEYDVPFCFLYSVSEDFDSDISSVNSGSLPAAPQCVLEGTLGVPEGHKAAFSPLDLKTSDDGFAPYLRESMKTDRPVLLTTEKGSLSYDLIDGLEWRGFGDPCRAAVVCPIHPTTGESILGFLVMGVNPRRPYDDDYSLFIQLLSRQLATSMASAMLFEEEIRQGQRAARLAALDRQELSKQLDLRTQEAVESETKFTRMAEFAPVGMFIANSSGDINYSNDTWWEISRHPRNENSAQNWMNSVKEEDQEKLRSIWKTLTEGTPVTHEFRFKTPWNDKNGNRGDTWVLMSAYPEKDTNGKLKSVFGSITNISAIKWAEDFRKCILGHTIRFLFPERRYFQWLKSGLATGLPVWNASSLSNPLRTSVNCEICREAKNGGGFRAKKTARELH
jgi:PAS domain S-box-containing protein